MEVEVEAEMEAEAEAYGTVGRVRTDRCHPESIYFASTVDIVKIIMLATSDDNDL